MDHFKKIICAAAIVVFSICFYAFLLGNGGFEGKFENDPFAWYFLAKGIFCSLSLYMGVRILTILSKFKQ